LFTHSALSEKEFEKIERLIDLHSQYISRTKKIEVDIEREKDELREEGVEITEAEEDEFYMRLLEAGLFTLQLVDVIIATICTEDATIRAKTESMLKLNNLSFDQVKATLESTRGL